MKTRAMEYDSEAVRREARKFMRCCEQLDESALPRVKSIRAELNENFQGRTADALQERLEQTTEKIRSLYNGCGSMYSALMRYADALEEADRRVAEMLSN